MGRKTSTSDNFERKCDEVEPKRTIDIIFEGLTEQMYFKQLEKNGLLKPYIFVDCIIKGPLNKDVSDRQQMIIMAHDYTKQKWSGKISCRRYVNLILKDFYETIVKRASCDKQLKDQCNLDEFCTEVRNFKNQIINECIEFGFDLDQNVPPEDGLYVLLSNKCSKKFNIEYMTSDTDMLFAGGYKRTDDEDVYVMFDRDANEEYFNDKMYTDCLNQCKKYHYNPLVTTPQFELWLLMHFKDANMNYPYDSHFKYSMLAELRERDFMARSVKEKEIPDERFELYRDNILQAITRSESSQFESDPESLMNHAGTNLGEFFKSLLLDPGSL